MEWFGTRNSSPDVVKRAGVRRHCRPSVRNSTATFKVRTTAARRGDSLHYELKINCFTNFEKYSQCPEMILNNIEKTFKKTYTG